MAAYLIVQLTVHDPETFEKYRELVPATLVPYGGEYIVRGGEMEVIEGDWPHPRCVSIKFPDMASAKAWYGSEEYAGPMALRHSAATTNAILVEGI